MKTRPLRILQNTFLLSLVLVYAGFALYRAKPYWLTRPPAGLTCIPGSGSYYALSDRSPQARAGLPVILCIGSAFDKPDVIKRLIGQFDEPVLLIWDNLLADLSENTTIDDAIAWEKKRREFARVFSRYRQRFRFDERRVYLTGFGFAGAYAWMLAYDRPEWYAGVVAMSAPAYPAPIQQRFGSGKSVVTVAVYGEKDPWLTNRFALLKATRGSIESLNPHSRLVLKEGLDRHAVAECWLANLKYILQFRKENSP